MLLFLLLGVSSFFLSLVLTPLSRNLFRRLGVFDQPGEGRKIHPTPIPRIGGIPLLLSLAISFSLLPALPSRFAPGPQILLVWRLLPAVLLVFLVGILDDLFRLRPWQKLIGQLAAAGWAYWVGVRVFGVAGYSTENWWSLPVTLFWLVLCTNAFNLIDGVDGLAAGLGLFATLTMLVAALAQNNVALAVATAPLAGCLLGFLRYNFNPASIFLGDAVGTGGAHDGAVHPAAGRGTVGGAALPAPPADFHGRPGPHPPSPSGPGTHAAASGPGALWPVQPGGYFLADADGGPQPICGAGGVVVLRGGLVGCAEPWLRRVQRHSRHGSGRRVPSADRRANPASPVRAGPGGQQVPGGVLGDSSGGLPDVRLCRVEAEL